MITIDELKAKLGGMKTAVDDLRDALSIEASEKRLAELEHQMTMPGFYDDQARSQKVISEMGEVKNKLERFGKLSTQYEEAETLLLMIEEENDPSLAAEGEEAVNGVEKSIDELQLMTMLNGEYDHNNAILRPRTGPRCSTACTPAGPRPTATASRCSTCWTATRPASSPRR